MSTSQSSPVLGWIAFICLLEAVFFPLAAVSSLRMPEESTWRQFIMLAWLPFMGAGLLVFFGIFLTALKGRLGDLQRIGVFLILTAVNAYAASVAYEATNDHIQNTANIQAGIDKVFGCSENPNYSCAKVNTHPVYSKLFGIAVAEWGLWVYVFMAGIFFMGVFIPWQSWQTISLVPSLIAFINVGMSAYLIRAIMIEIQENCPLCYTMHSTHAITLVLIFILLMPEILSPIRTFFHKDHRTLGLSGFATVLVAWFGFFIWSLIEIQTIQDFHQKRAEGEKMKVLRQPGLKSTKKSADGKTEPLTKTEIQNQYQEEKVYQFNFAHTPIYPPGATEKDYPITIVAFEDFGCSQCQDFSQNWIPKMMEAFPNKIRVAFKHYPFDTSCNFLIKHGDHPNACQASYASMAVKKVYGDGMFHVFEDFLFSNQKQGFEPKKIEEYFLMKGLDLNQLLPILSSDEIKNQIKADIEEAQKLGVVQSTPTYFINGRLVKLINTSQELQSVIAAILELQEK